MTIVFDALLMRTVLWGEVGRGCSDSIIWVWNVLLWCHFKHKKNLGGYSVYTVSWKFCLNTLLKDKIFMTFIVALIRENPNCCYNNSVDFCVAFSFCIYSAVMTAYVLLFVCSAAPPPPPPFCIILIGLHFIFKSFVVDIFVLTRFDLLCK